MDLLLSSVLRIPSRPSDLDMYILFLSGSGSGGGGGGGGGADATENLEDDLIEFADDVPFVPADVPL